MDRPWLGRAVAMAFSGGATRGPSTKAYEASGSSPEGTFVVDAPCGARVAFMALSPSQRLRYLALDLSPLMLARAGRRARFLELGQIEFVQGDAERIPLDNGSVDLFLSYWGLHCMSHPGAAVREIARCLRRGGRVVGAMICRGPSLRQRLILRPGTRSFGPGGTVDELAHWLAAAGLKQTRLEVSGALAYFEASA